jgi:hypothetical protein
MLTVSVCKRFSVERMLPPIEEVGKPWLIATSVVLRAQLRECSFHGTLKHLSLLLKVLNTAAVRVF